MPDTAPTVTEPFSAAIRKASWAAHGDAEQAAYLTELTEGRLDLRGYADMVVQHFFMYEALEAAADAMRDDPVAGPFVDDALTRLPAIQRDLEALLGAGWRAQVAPSPATAEYAARIDEVGRSWPGGFVAHHYVRYLGDLSGGQMLRGTIEKIYGIDASSGTAFYDFSGIPDLTAFKEAYRARLDAAAWDDEERARIIDEVLAGYRWNTDVLVELAP